MAKITRKQSVVTTPEEAFSRLSMDQIKLLVKSALEQEHASQKLKSKAAINEDRTEAETDIIQSLMLAMRRSDVKAVWIGAYYDYALRKWVETIDQYSFGGGRTFSPSAEKHLTTRLMAARQQTRLPVELRKRPVGMDRSKWTWDQGDLNTVKSIILRYPDQPPQSMIQIVADKYLVTKDKAAEVVAAAYSEIKQGKLVAAEQPIPKEKPEKFPDRPIVPPRVLVRRLSPPPEPEPTVTVRSKKKTKATAKKSKSKKTRRVAIEEAKITRPSRAEVAARKRLDAIYAENLRKLNINIAKAKAENEARKKK